MTSYYLSFSHLLENRKHIHSQPQESDARYYLGDCYFIFDSNDQPMNIILHCVTVFALLTGVSIAAPVKSDDSCDYNVSIIEAET